jgi:hypothetical protein
MAERAHRRQPAVVTLLRPALLPDTLDETVVHDPSGRPWLVSTTDVLYGQDGVERPPFDEAPQVSAWPPAGTRYETQVYYTARAGIRGFPTGHGQRFSDRESAVTGHRNWCLRVRTGQVVPDLAPDEPL